MSAQLVKCHKCRKPIGYVTVLSEGLTGIQQSIENLKIIGICMECYRKK